MDRDVLCFRIGKISPFKHSDIPVFFEPERKNESSLGNRSVPSKAWQSGISFVVIKNLCLIG